MTVGTELAGLQEVLKSRSVSPGKAPSFLSPDDGTAESGHQLIDLLNGALNRTQACAHNP